MRAMFVGAMVAGWIINFLKLVLTMAFHPISAELLIRAFGVVAAPVGSVLGLFW